jgi:hypothetical protein
MKNWVKMSLWTFVTRMYCHGTVFPLFFLLVCSRVLRWFFPNTKAELQFTKKKLQLFDVLREWAIFDSGGAIGCWAAPVAKILCRPVRGGCLVVLVILFSQRFSENLVSSLLRLTNSKKFPHSPPWFFKAVLGM